MMTHEKKTDLRDEVRAAIEDRATWFYLLLREFNGGQEIKEVPEACRAIFKFGLMKGEQMPPAKTPGEWAANLITPVGRQVFEQNLVKAGDDEAVIEFSYCPLVEAWRKLGAAPQEVAVLCKMARCGDHGRISPFDLELTFEKLLAEGDDRCRLVVHRK
ncbi:MAG: L-2-amino-thiazoline-4-carboxylic acid hydrolase [Bacillota bacterium]